IFDLRIEFAGDETESDKTVIRGRFEDKSFINLYLKDDLLKAYLAVNISPREFIPLQRLIRRRVDLSPHLSHLQDRDYDLRSLVPR
ncbi:MAG: pyridine nucleotide-disulfide oxidoreductase, partial [Dehalococcoidia bacterium]|nr:pyridine nucleotide-disulfide oxidoreductase [Dehalococcoidia bacterium]